MTQFSNAELLRQTYANDWQQYLALLQPSTRGGWDECVLTASDERQAAMYRRQLEWRAQAKQLPVHTHFQVVADPAGQRVGSGAATLRVLQLLKEHDSNIGQKRVLIIHSGGDARRLPHCSITGKLFARVPRELPDGRASTVFDEFLISLSGLAMELTPGVLIASGDVLLIFDHLQLSLRRAGVTGVAIAAPMEMGTRHGVYAEGHGIHRVRAYLHKPSMQRLNQFQAIDPNGLVQIDTGLVWLDVPTAQIFAELMQDRSIARLCRMDNMNGPADGSVLNLYGDLLLPMAQATTYSDYLNDTSDGPATPDVRAAREYIWTRLHDIPFTVESLQPAMFIHFGTSQEYWRTVSADPDLRMVCGWVSQAGSILSGPDQPDTARVTLINSALEGTLTSTGDPSLVTDSQLSGPFSWQGPVVVANTHTAESLKLQPNVIVHQVALPNGYATRIYGMLDDPKRVIDDPTATYMNRPWAEWLAEAGVHADAIWPGIDRPSRSLWNAQLYPICASRDESLRLAQLLQIPSGLAPMRSQWYAMPRISLQQSFASADGEAVLTDVSQVEDYIAARRFLQAVLDEQQATEATVLLGSVAPSITRRCALVDQLVRQTEPLVRIRCYQALAIADGNKSYEDRAFHALSQMVQASVVGSTRPTVQHAGSIVAAQKATSATVRVETAARIDFGGGWTDTPPYSIERGGTVLNAALLLSEPSEQKLRYPIVTEVTRLDEPRLVLQSRDIESTIEPKYVRELLDYANPADPFALHKAALVLRGIVPASSDANRPVSDLMRENRSGILVSTQTCIPRGSGLGTSSILAGAVLTSLAQFTGETLPQAQLFDEVLALEQMMTTGGGWQDQVGGLIGGIKLVHTAPGLPQVIRYDPLQLDPVISNELAGRLVVVYTGQQRMAKNLLRMMMSRWMARVPLIVESLGEIARLAQQMHDCLVKGDITAFGELVGYHWEVNKRMDPGCTNPFIDTLFDLARPYVNGGKLAGAGGGGFALMVARNKQAARDYAALLAKHYPGTLVGEWKCAFPVEGIKVV